MSKTWSSRKGLTECASKTESNVKQKPKVKRFCRIVSQVSWNGYESKVFRYEDFKIRIVRLRFFLQVSIHLALGSSSSSRISYGRGGHVGWKERNFRWVMNIWYISYYGLKLKRFPKCDLAIEGFGAIVLISSAELEVNLTPPSEFRVYWWCLKLITMIR